MSDNNVIRDILIVGGGPAGLTAAIYAARGGLDTLVVEKAFLGGQLWLSESIENYPGFSSGINSAVLSSEMEKQATNFGAQLINDEVLYLDKDDEGTIIVNTSSQVHRARGIIIASGAVQRPLGVEGEKDLTGKGVSYCAVCDGPLYREKRVAVIGGGNTAAEEALFLSKFASEVILIHRRERLRAVAALKKKVEEKTNISIIYNRRVKKIFGKESVEALLLDDASSIDLEGVFIFAGLDPNTGFNGGFAPEKDGFILTAPNMVSETEGVFAAGDCRYGSLRQVVTACSEGAIAAESARHYVEKMKGTSYD